MSSISGRSPIQATAPFANGFGGRTRFVQARKDLPARCAAFTADRCGWSRPFTACSGPTWRKPGRHFRLGLGRHRLRDEQERKLQRSEQHHVFAASPRGAACDAHLCQRSFLHSGPGPSSSGNGCQTTGTTCLNAGTVSTDDLWLRIGQWNVWDLKVGRFEGWEVFHTGMGLDINTFERMGAWATSGSQPPDYYGVSFLHDRPQALGRATQLRTIIRSASCVSSCKGSWEPQRSRPRATTSGAVVRSPSSTSDG